MEDAEGTLAKAGIHEGGAQPRLKRVRGFVCDVCYDDATKETLAMSCDHRCASPFSHSLELEAASSGSVELVHHDGPARTRLTLGPPPRPQSARTATRTTSRAR